MHVYIQIDALFVHLSKDYSKTFLVFFNFLICCNKIFKSTAIFYYNEPTFNELQNLIRKSNF